MNTILCPHCKKEVELSEAIVHQLSQQVRDEERKNLKAEFEKEKAQEQATNEKKLREEFELQNKENVKQLQEARKKEKELEEKLEKEQEERHKVEAKIKEEAIKKAESDQRLKLKEKDLQIEQIRKANEEIRKANDDLKRKLEQGSQQMQGEVLELDLEEKLKSTFPNDEFLPVPKGVEGGDIWQKIKNNGKIVGSILWETKRTKAWSNGWTTKLKGDAGTISASEAIIVSQVLPTDCNHFDRKNGVWITTYEYAINIGRYVRFLISTVASVKFSASQTEDEWEKIRGYMLSDSFKHRMQAHFDGIKALKDNLDAEKRSTILKWKKQDAIIDKLDVNTINFYGELKAIVSNLPELKGVDVPLLETNEENDQESLL